MYIFRIFVLRVYYNNCRIYVKTRNRLESVNVSETSSGEYYDIRNK